MGQLNLGDLIYWACTLAVAIVTVSPVWLNIWLRTKALERDVKLMKEAHEECLRDRSELNSYLTMPWPDDPSKIQTVMKVLRENKLPHTMREAIKVLKNQQTQE